MDRRFPLRWSPTRIMNSLARLRRSRPMSRPARSFFSPWVAAVWVEPHARRRGIGAALVSRAAGDCFALGFSRAYLCARPPRSGFYERLGWRTIERHVGPDRLSILIQDAAPEPSELK